MCRCSVLLTITEIVVFPTLVFIALTDNPFGVITNDATFTLEEFHNGTPVITTPVPFEIPYVILLEVVFTIFNFTNEYVKSLNKTPLIKLILISFSLVKMFLFVRIRNRLRIFDL